MKSTSVKAVRSAFIVFVLSFFNSPLLFSQTSATNNAIQLDGINSSVYLNQSGFQGTTYTLSGWVKKPKPAVSNTSSETTPLVLALSSM